MALFRKAAILGSSRSAVGSIKLDRLEFQYVVDHRVVVHVLYDNLTMQVISKRLGFHFLLFAGSPSLKRLRADEYRYLLVLTSAAPQGQWLSVTYFAFGLSTLEQHMTLSTGSNGNVRPGGCR
jgi:hypothetical protein